MNIENLIFYEEKRKIIVLFPNDLRNEKNAVN